MSNNKQSSLDYYITKLTEILGPEIIKQISRDDNERIARLEKRTKAMHTEETTITENTSDGYHTFKELYEFRKAYNVALFNEWGSQTIVEKKVGGAIIETIGKFNVHKSWKHHDGELCFGGGWFIVVAVLPTGQISNHYKAEDWDLFKIPEVEKALFPFDGHTGEDVIKRLLEL